MFFEQFYLGCLAHASYMLGSGGVAVVVDPQRDVEQYLETAARQGLQIQHIFETHLHADFVSGHQELAQRTGAKIYIGERAGARFPHVPLRDGFRLPFGDCELRVLETPGHTPESICLLVFDPERGGEQPWAVLTGDTLFVGDVGRPDLSDACTPEQLAGMMYDSLHQKLLTLPDEVRVYPAHGAGSLCGRNMRAERYTTIGNERLTNPALQMQDRAAFIRELTAKLPPRPEYFAQDAQINREGAVALADLPELPAFTPREVIALQQHSAVVLDTRPSADFATSHVPGSVNIGLGGQFASWAGAVLGLAARVVLVAESPAKVAEARLRLARVAMENVIGYLKDGVCGWQMAGCELASIPQITVEELRRHMREFRVLDVRREAEWQAGHIEGATWYPLDNFLRGLPPLTPDSPIAVHCKGGYRSIIAASLLRRAGYANVTDVLGGYDAWAAASAPATVAG